MKGPVCGAQGARVCTRTRVRMHTYVGVHVRAPEEKRPPPPTNKGDARRACGVGRRRACDARERKDRQK